MDGPAVAAVRASSRAARPAHAPTDPPTDLRNGPLHGPSMGPAIGPPLGPPEGPALPERRRPAHSGVLTRGALPVLALLVLPGCFRAPTWSPGSVAATWQPTPLAAEELDRERAAAQAVARSPEVAAARAAARAAEAGVSAADQLVNPELRLSQLRLDQMVDGQTTVELGLRFKPERPGAIDARVYQATMAVEEARAAVGEAERRAAAGARSLVERVATARRAVSALDAEIAVREELRRAIAERVEAAAEKKTRLAETDMDLAAARDDRGALELERAEAEATLARTIGGSVQLAGEPALVELADDDDALVRRALEARPALRAQQARIAAAQGDAWVARSEAWPWISFVQVDYDLEPEPEPLAFGVGLGVDLPLFSWNSGAIEEADARIAGLRGGLDAAAQAVASEVSTAAARVRATASRVRAVRDGLIPAVDAARVTIEEAVTSGSEDPIAGIRARLESARAQTRLVRALAAHREAVAALEAVLGEPVTPARGHTPPQ